MATKADTVTHKISVGIATYSPYATWKFKLVSLSGNSGIFDRLLQYKNLVNLELVGTGSGYENEDICKSNLEKYYKEVDLKYSDMSKQP